MDRTGSAGGRLPLVAVIGAGAAGLAAADMLAASKRVRVVVLEARKRPGGRVETDRGWGVPIDLGASWIHGTMGNPVTDLRDRLELDTVVTDVTSIAMYDRLGQRLDADEQAEIERVAEEVIEEIDRPTASREPDDFLGVEVASALARAGKMSALRRAGVRFLLWEHIENEWGASAWKLSARWYKDTRFEGEQEVFPGGYDQVFVRLAEPIDVQYENIVQEIHHDTGGVMVVTSKQKVEASHAIVTLPLGVLKKDRVRFVPDLPPDKKEAIERLEMGVLSKTWLRFPEAFWSNDAQIHAYLGTKDGRWSSWYDFEEVVGAPVLLGLNGGDVGRQIEAMTDKAIVTEAVAVLNRCFPDANIDPAKVGILQSRWTRDDYSEGSYSHIPPRATPDDRDTLADPVAGRLLFAGEATHRTCSQTVHGAVLSGWREAHRLLSML